MTIKKRLVVMTTTLVVTALVAAGAVLAQTTAQATPPAQPPSDPLTKSLQGALGYVGGNITKAAEQMPEANYAFKPTPEVRSFGQILGHVADANYMFCSVASGEKPPVTDIEKTKTTKADLQKALTDAFAYCDKVFAGMSDTKGVEMVPFFVGGQQPKLAILALNTAHDFEHYGNIVTYLRLKGLVPPSSQH
jgi:uncharacterized damage-inducible protein DinB